MTSAEVAAAVVAAVHIWQELDEDYVGLWKVQRYARRELPSASDAEVFALAGATLQGLLRLGAVLGELDGESGFFTPWPNTDPVADAIAAWRALERDSRFGEVVWIARPD